MSWKSVDYTVRPIEIWPGKRTPVSSRTRSPFKGSWSRTLEELSRELGMLGARNIIFRLDIEERHLRNDGQMRADARPKDSGVLLEFIASRRPGQPRLVFRCDRFSFWQDNLLAIALGLEKLRAIDRYGITDASEQYAGFKALPASATPTMNAATAAEIIASFSAGSVPDILEKTDVARHYVRAAVFRTHPDRNNGDQSMFDRVAAARSVLSAHHGASI